jgi:hypothetical protein
VLAAAMLTRTTAASRGRDGSRKVRRLGLYSPKALQITKEEIEVDDSASVILERGIRRRREEEGAPDTWGRAVSDKQRKAGGACSREFARPAALAGLGPKRDAGEKETGRAGGVNGRGPRATGGLPAELG